MRWLARQRGANRGTVLAALAIAVVLALAVALVWPVTDLTGANFDHADLTGAKLAAKAVPPRGWVQDRGTGFLRRSPQP